MTKTLLLPMSRRLASIGLALASLTLLVGAVPAKPAASAWSTHIGTSAIGAHIVGNPAAKVRLIEYYSYTCPHCAHFAAESATALKTQYIDKGLVVVEYRNMVRDAVDMTAALLAHCGDAKTFVGNHQAIFAAQPVWLGKVMKLTPEQQKAWYEGDLGQRAARIAADAGLDKMMKSRGYTSAQITTCLNDNVTLSELTAMTNVGTNADHVTGTPSFIINGKLLDEVHAWPALKTRLDAAIKPS